MDDIPDNRIRFGKENTDYANNSRNDTGRILLTDREVVVSFDARPGEVVSYPFFSGFEVCIGSLGLAIPC